MQNFYVFAPFTVLFQLPRWPQVWHKVQMEALNSNCQGFLLKEECNLFCHLGLSEKCCSWRGHQLRLVQVVWRSHDHAGPSEIGVTAWGAVVLIARIKHFCMADDDLKQQADLQAVSPFVQGCLSAAHLRQHILERLDNYLSGSWVIASKLFKLLKGKNFKE